MLFIRGGGAVDVVGLLVVGLDLVVLICAMRLMMRRSARLCCKESIGTREGFNGVDGVGDLLGGVDLLGDGLDGGPVIDGDSF